jgi:hypothetical protein
MEVVQILVTDLPPPSSSSSFSLSLSLSLCDDNTFTLKARCATLYRTSDSSVGHAVCSPNGYNSERFELRVCLVTSDGVVTIAVGSGLNYLTFYKYRRDDPRTHINGYTLCEWNRCRRMPEIRVEYQPQGEPIHFGSPSICFAVTTAHGEKLHAVIENVRRSSALFSFSKFF